MEDTNTKAPLFKKLDTSIFAAIDKFKQNPNYNTLQDFYNSLEEEQQKIFKASVILALFAIPLIFLSLMWWQNNKLKADLDLRLLMVENINKITGQNQGLKNIAPSVLSMNPIDSESMMTSRISNLLSSISIDLAKLQVSDFNSNNVSDKTLKSEADFAFTNLSTDELMNLFTSMIQREKFRIQSVKITRNADSNLLNGQFHAIHFSSLLGSESEEE